MFNAGQSPVSSIKIISLQKEMRKLNSEVEFLLVLSGTIRMEKNRNTVYMKQNDVMMIRPNEFPVFNAADSNLILLMTIQKEFFICNGITSLDYFCCDSVTDETHDYSELIKILSRIAITHYDQSSSDAIYQIELCYSLIHYLSVYHQFEYPVIEKDTIDSTNRKEMIMTYLEQNYMNPLTLTELAELTHLNSSYLSRYFRKMTGGTFNKCLKTVRLNHALSDLHNNEKSITSIAYENGFSNPAAFCKAFTQEYHITPSKYRKSIEAFPAPPSSVVPEDESIRTIEYQDVKDELNSLATISQDNELNLIKYPRNRNLIVENATLNIWIRPLWRKLINLGFGTNLKNSDFQKQLQLVQREIGFEYGRVEGVLSPEILPYLQNGGYNFSDFDNIFLAMLSNNIKPYIDLSLRGANVLLPGKDKVFYRYYDIVQQTDSFLDRLEALIIHCINFFGTDEVNTWILDLGIFHNENLELLETPSDYAKRACASMAVIRKYLKDIRVGAVSFNAGMELGTWEAIIQEIQKEDFRPDFFSTCVFPYSPVSGKLEKFRLVTSDPNHVRHEILKEKSVLEQYPSLSQSLWLVAMGVSIQTMDYVNDTCFQATYFIKNTIDILGFVDAIGYYQLSDISEAYYNTSRILYGASGILSKHGIKKPGFSALKRLSQSENRLIAKDDCFLVTTDRANIYHMVLCNYAYFNEMYCISGAHEMQVEKTYDSFEEPETQMVTVTFHGLRKGKYKIICAQISREYGSLFDEWLRYGILDDLHFKDIQYFHDIVHPHRSAHYMNCEDGTLVISTQLLPHETRFYEIIRMI